VIVDIGGSRSSRYPGEAMTTLKERMANLRMSQVALARRSKLEIDVLKAVLKHPTDATASSVERVCFCLGMSRDGLPLVPNRTFRKHAARKKARFVVSIVQGTMGLEAQGLDPVARSKLLQKTSKRFERNPHELW